MHNLPRFFYAQGHQNAVRFAGEAIKQDVNKHIVEELESY